MVEMMKSEGSVESGSATVKFSKVRIYRPRPGRDSRLQKAASVSINPFYKYKRYSGQRARWSSKAIMSEPIKRTPSALCKASLHFRLRWNSPVKIDLSATEQITVAAGLSGAIKMGNAIGSYRPEPLTSRTKAPVYAPQNTPAPAP